MCEFRGNSKRCLKWDGGGWRTIKKSQLKLLERRQELFIGGGVLSQHPYPFPENFNYTQIVLMITSIDLLQEVSAIDVLTSGAILN